MDVATGGVTGGTTDVYLIVQAGQKLLRFRPLATGADHLGAPRGQDGFLEAFGHIAFFGHRVVHLHKVGAQAGRHTDHSGDQVRIEFITYRPAPRIDPQNRDQPHLVGLEDNPRGLSQHPVLELTARVNGVADTHDLEAGLFPKAIQLFHALPLAADGVSLVGLDQVGLAVEFDQVRDIGIVRAVAGDEPEMGGKNPDSCLAGDPE